MRYTLAAGVEALVISGLFLLDTQPGSVAHRSAVVVLFAVAGVTGAGMLASWARERRDRQLARVRLVVGDAEGKGLPALQSAADVLGVFREAAQEEESLAAIASRIEASLARRPGAGRFVTAILAEISEDGAKMELISCGHPAGYVGHASDDDIALLQAYRDNSLPGPPLLAGGSCATRQ